jgi:solute carrier family 25 S-adenosylmethionine transporter 26
MKEFRSYGHVLLLFSFPESLAYHTSTIQQKITENGGRAGTSGLATRISADPVISRSFFFSTVAMATFTAPIVAIAMPPDELASFSSKEGIDTQHLDVAQHQISLQAKDVAGPSSLQESMSGFIAGGALAATKTLVKYPLDTATVRLQVPGSGYSVSELGKLFSGSYDGVTASLLSNIPAGAVFFAVKDAAKASLKNSAMNAAPAWVTTTLAVGAALIPYWIIRNPSEVIKVRQQTGVPGYGDGVSAWDAVQLTFNETAAAGGSNLDGIGGFYTGYWENIIYGLPADVIKFVAYESITGGRKDLSPVEGARAGAVATVRFGPRQFWHKSILSSLLFSHLKPHSATLSIRQPHSF